MTITCSHPGAGSIPGAGVGRFDRKSKPLGVKLTANGFPTEAAALAEGKKELNVLLSNLLKEEIRARK